MDHNLLDSNLFKVKNENSKLKKDIIKPVVDIFKEKATTQGVKIDVKCDIPDITLRLDRMRTKQILINLLSNAIKFSNRDDIISIEVV